MKWAGVYSEHFYGSCVVLLSKENIPSKGGGGVINRNMVKGCLADLSWSSRRVEVECSETGFFTSLDIGRTTADAISETRLSKLYNSSCHICNYSYLNYPASYMQHGCSNYATTAAVIRF